MSTETTKQQVPRHHVLSVLCRAVLVQMRRILVIVRLVVWVAAFVPSLGLEVARPDAET
jgi:hypothetical protein